MSTKMRRFSRREEELVVGMIQSISRNISLAESYGDEARDIGWSVFLSVYGKYPAWFLWTGAGGWARAYLEIQEELPGRTLVIAHNPQLPLTKAAKEFLNIL